MSFSNTKTYDGTVRCVRRGDVTPDAFGFTDQIDVATSTLIESDIVEITGMDDGTAVSITGDGSPEYRICADATCSAVNHDWTSGSGSIDAGEYLQLRLTSHAAGSAMHSATVTVGTENDQWDVTTDSGGPTGCPSIGDVCSDGTVYAGLSPDGNVAMYTTPTDAESYVWLNGPGWMDTAMANCTDATPGTALSCRTGEANTALLVGLSDSTSDSYDAALHCDGLSAHGHTDWYLPAQDELYVLYDNRVAIGGFVGSGRYWSSSEYDNDRAKVQQFLNGEQSRYDKYSHSRVRCVRRD